MGAMGHCHGGGLSRCPEEIQFFFTDKAGLKPTSAGQMSGPFALMNIGSLFAGVGITSFSVDFVLLWLVHPPTRIMERLSLCTDKNGLTEFKKCTVYLWREGKCFSAVMNWALDVKTILYAVRTECAGAWLCGETVWVSLGTKLKQTMKSWSLFFQLLENWKKTTKLRAANQAPGCSIPQPAQEIEKAARLND